MVRRSAERTAPSPRGYPLIGNLLEFRRDALKLGLDAVRMLGDIVRLRLGPYVVHLINHPDYIQHVLLTNQKNYDRATRSASQIRLLTGESLLTTSGDIWLRERGLVQPAFHQQRLASYAPAMIGATAAMLRQWATYAQDQRPIAIDSEMSRLTYTIVGRALFGADVSREAETVERALGFLLDRIYARLERVVSLPLWFPSPENRRFRAARRALDEIVYRIIHERRQQGGGDRDVLGCLLHALDAGPDGGMTDEELRNETITLLMAGHETTANALSWTLYLLAVNPDVERRLTSEVAAVLGGRVPRLEDLPNLKYTTMVLNESLRLYPPIWIVERRAIAHDEIGGYDIPARSTVVVSPYILHRHTVFWPNSEEFNPDRFSEAQVANRAANTFLPFGAGAHHCIGASFAMVEARFILTMIMQKYRLRLLPVHPIEPKAGITLRLRHGLPMTAQERVEN